MNVSQQFNEAYQNVTLSRPGWEKEIEEMTYFFPKQPSERDSFDSLFEDAARLVVKSKIASTSMIQRNFAIGYNRGEKIMNQLEKVGIVGPANGSKPRILLVDNQDALEQIIKSID